MCDKFEKKDYSAQCSMSKIVTKLNFGHSVQNSMNPIIFRSAVTELDKFF